MSEPEPEIKPPSLWRMAASAAQAATQFAASGFKTVPAESQQQRIEVCDGCKYRQENVCQVCGCYLDKKTWLPFEDCPLGKWPI